MDKKYTHKNQDYRFTAYLCVLDLGNVTQVLVNNDPVLSVTYI